MSTGKKDGSEDAAGVPAREKADVAVKRSVPPAASGAGDVMVRPDAPLAGPGEKGVTPVGGDRPVPENLKKS